jgi:hypothetical protein
VPLLTRLSRSSRGVLLFLWCVALIVGSITCGLWWRAGVCVCGGVGGGGGYSIPPYTPIQAKEESTLGLCELLPLVSTSKLPLAQDLAITRVANIPPVLALLSHAVCRYGRLALFVTLASIAGIICSGTISQRVSSYISRCITEFQYHV